MKIEPGLESKVTTLAENGASTCISTLGIEATEITRDRLVATMPVDERTRQPFGILHGGASLVLAETLASNGAWINVDESRYDVVGVEINANHLRSVASGRVTGTAIPLHRGRRTQVWEVRITNEEGALVCISRCTIAVIEKRATAAPGRA